MGITMARMRLEPTHDDASSVYRNVNAEGSNFSWFFERGTSSDPSMARSFNVHFFSAARSQSLPPLLTPSTTISRISVQRESLFSQLIQHIVSAGLGALLHNKFSFSISRTVRILTTCQLLTPRGPSYRRQLRYNNL